MSDELTPIDLLVVGGELLTMDGDPSSQAGQAVAIADGRILAIGPEAELRVAHDPIRILDANGGLVMPGLVNAHQHLTGDPLIRGCIPDLIDSDTSIYQWAVPVHAVHDETDDRLAATLESLRCLRSGTTSVIEAGTVSHPEAVAAGLEATGIRGTVGLWGWDTPDVPHRRSADDFVRDMSTVLDAHPSGERIEAWVTLVGHGLASDELFVAAADLARERKVGMTMHMSPGSSDTEDYQQRLGRSPIEHLAHLGVLGPHLVLAHAVWIDDDEFELLLEHDVAIASCPWAYLRLAQGFSVAGRHGEFVERGGRLAFGTDSCNASDHHSVLAAAALFAGLERDRSLDPTRFGAHRALEIATRGGAAVLGHGDDLGVLAPGRLADLIVVEANGLDWSPAGDPALQLVWGAPDRRVRHVVVAGDPVLVDGHSTKIDEAALIAEVADRQQDLLARAGITR